MSWYPHVTVATIVELRGKFLMVEERDASGKVVFNQPAGHLERDETLVQCAVRETLEETGWRVQPIAVLNIRLYQSPQNNVTYLRTNVIAKALEQVPQPVLDPDIIAAHWLTAQQLQSEAISLRSPLVLQAINDFHSGMRYPLTIIDADSAVKSSSA